MKDRLTTIRAVGHNLQGEWDDGPGGELDRRLFCCVAQSDGDDPALFTARELREIADRMDEMEAAS